LWDTKIIYLQFIAILLTFFGEQDAIIARFAPQNITLTNKLMQSEKEKYEIEAKFWREKSIIVESSKN
jgi:hypothetical protein